MKIQIEKETKFDVAKMEVSTYYFIMLNERCVHAARSEEEARNIVEGIKQKYTAPVKEIIYEEEV